MNNTEAKYDDFRRNVGLRIVKLRLEKGLSQRKFASMIELDRVTLNRIEAGKANPTISTLKRIADGLDISIEDLLID